MAEKESNVIVAIPSTDDYVWKVSSEIVPHMTLLYFDDLSDDPDLESIVEFLQHAVDTSLTRFGMSVDRRGTLGDKGADVVFFSDEYDQKIARFRQLLLQNDKIQIAYNAVQQFPAWIPHLTLGFPETPAHPDNRDYPGIGWVGFEKIALWTSDYEGPEFELKPESLGLSMSDPVKDILEHHGIKGMHWGVRRTREQIDVSTSHTPGKRVKTTGGKNQPAHADAIAAASSRQKARKSTTDSLSNEELQKLVTRMNLEAQYSKLSTPQKSEGKKFVEAQLKQAGEREIRARAEGKDSPTANTVKSVHKSVKIGVAAIALAKAAKR